MKIGRARSQQVSGGILVVTLVVCSLVGMMLACYLKMVSSQNSYTFRSQVWNSAIPLCEAGIEEAMAHLNSLGTNNSFAVNGWVASTNGYTKDRTMPEGSYTAVIDTNFPPVITVSGKVRAPLQTARYITRSVQVRTKWNYNFPQAILAKSSIDLGGTSSRIDSFISTNAANGQWSLLNARDEAPVACLATTPGKFDLANTKINGRIGTSAGGNVIYNSGAAGDKFWVTLNSGVQAGHYVNDLNLYVPDIAVPGNFGPVFAPSGRTVGGVAYKYVFDDGYYRMSTLVVGSHEQVLVRGNARVHIQGQMTIGSGGYIEVATNGNFVVYCGGNVDLKGSGVINRRGYAKNFSLNGLPTCTSIDYGGSSDFIGTVYAPQATVKITGGGHATGAIVADSFDFKGGFQLHYDECLQGIAEVGRFLVDSWIEL